MSSATKKARASARGRAQWLHEISDFLCGEIEMPVIDIPELDISSNPGLISNDDIEKATLDTRASWGLRDGPIPHLGKLLESKGIILSRIALNATKLDGLSGRSTTGRPYIILNSEKASSVRSRFDAAHELGHLILHNNSPIRPESALYRLMEIQAHKFAGAFLFPREAVFDEISLSDLDSLVGNKERWKISIAAIISRLYNLDLIDEYKKIQLYKQMSSRGWRTWEPLDDELIPERPFVLSHAYKLICEEGGVDTI
jgi:Zn-dependent peptidase ImmA (M78 family)